LIHLLFFLSGLSGLIYQVVWVRVFGNVFGNTIHSAALVVAVFMLGLGAGGYLVGAWADRRYARRPDSLLRTYGHIEIVVALMGLAIAAILPHLGAISAAVSSYTREPSGWYALSAMSYLARAGIAVALIAPITLLMGGTLTLLIRHRVRDDLEVAGWRIAALYGVNTTGAALGCFLTDFALVPAYGLFATQALAVVLNLVAGTGALLLARAAAKVRLTPDTTREKKGKRRRDGRSARLQPGPESARRQPDPEPVSSGLWRPIVYTSLALALAGFAAMGMEILWFRHFSILLGGFRAVYSLLLTVILIGIGVGSLLGGLLDRRTRRPAEWFMIVQALFVASTLAGFAIADVRPIDAAMMTADGGGVQPGLARMLTELWFNGRPILVEVAVPALLMGFSFPLANAVIQRTEQSVGRRAGLLYLANTAGAVCGSLAAGFLLLPAAGLQLGATILAAVAAVAVVPLYMAARLGVPSPDPRSPIPEPRAPIPAFASSLAVCVAALGLWLLLPADHVVSRAFGPPENGARLLTLTDGLTEAIAVTELPGQGRTLVTNGHPMSSTRPLAQRYMRALAHIPLLSMEEPGRVLVIGFGVGNTTQAATLHPSVQRVELADLSRDILAHAGYFADANRDVLSDPRVVVHINDGRQHLQMQPPGVYDLITLEPPPIGYAGVSALYSREFYALARSRLEPGGYVSQWLPAYQVPTSTTLSMVRAFVDVFPEAVLLSGAEADLILLGINGPGIEIDPGRVAGALAAAPAVREDLERLDLGTVREIAGTFIGSAETLEAATRGAPPVSDDRPFQEYGVHSLLNFGEAVPASVVDLAGLASWCPRCYVNGQPAVEGLDSYIALLDLAYSASPADVARARQLAEREGRTIAGSGYLGAIVPESAELYNLLGIVYASRGDFERAIVEFQHALTLAPDSAATHWHLGAALASRGERAEAIGHLQRAVEIDPANARAQNDLGLMLTLVGRLDEAVEHLERAVALDPALTDARNTLEILREDRGPRAPPPSQP
jgi:spermidine synthase